MELKKMEDLTVLLLQEIKNRKRCKRASKFFTFLFIVSTLATLIFTFFIGVNVISLLMSWSSLTSELLTYYVQLIFTTYGIPLVIASIAQQFFMSWMIFFLVAKNKKNTNVAYLHAEFLNSAPAI